MTKIVAAFLSNIEKLRTLSAFNPDRSATKKGHRLIAEPAACASESRRSTEGRTEGAGSRGRRRGEGEMKKKMMMMMMKRMRREEKRREGREPRRIGSLVAMRVPITGGGLESRRDAALCALIASCTRRRRRYVQRREPTYRTRSRGPIGHRNDQSSFDILSPCSVRVCAKPPRRAMRSRLHVHMHAHVRRICTHVMSRSIHRERARYHYHRWPPLPRMQAIESASDTRLRAASNTCSVVLSVHR